MSSTTANNARIPKATVDPWPGLSARWVDELRWIRWAGSCSRSDLHRGLGLRKNTVGEDIAALLQQGMVRETQEKIPTHGRPGMLLEIDPKACEIVGVSIEPGQVGVGRFNLLGQTLDPTKTRRVQRTEALLENAVEMIRESRGRKTLAVGLSVPGYVDLDNQQVLFSSAWPGRRHIPLNQLRQAVGDLPFITGNHMQGLAAKWMLEQTQPPAEDHLVIYLSDGQIGATLTSANKSASNGLIAANELGHMRMAARTEPCYCGHHGCLERIFSSAYLMQLSGRLCDLGETIRQRPDDAALQQIRELLVLGLTNAINFAQVTHIVLLSDLVGGQAFLNDLIKQVQDGLLVELAERVMWHLDLQADQGVAATGAANVLGRLFL